MFDEDYEDSYVTRDSGKKQVHSDGVQRDTRDGKTLYTLMFPKGVPLEEQLIHRVAELYTRGAEKYGDRNWENSRAEDTLEHHREALWRHFMKFFMGVQDGEDHAAAIVWNINAIEHTQRNLKADPPMSEDLEQRLTEALYRSEAAAALDDDIDDEEHVPAGNGRCRCGCSGCEQCPAEDEEDFDVQRWHRESGTSASSIPQEPRADDAYDMALSWQPPGRCFSSEGQKWVTDPAGRNWIEEDGHWYRIGRPESYETTGLVLEDFNDDPGRLDDCEVKSQMPEMPNPSDAEVELARSILDARQQHHDHEAAELLKKAPRN